MKMLMLSNIHCIAQSAYLKYAKCGYVEFDQARTFAASQGDLIEIKSLEAKGIDLNEADYDGRTPIHIAASEGHFNIVEYFILRNLRLDPKDRWGGTPLEDAKRHNHDKIIKLLESKLNGVKS